MDLLKESALENKIGVLQAEFRKELPIRISLIEDLWSSFTKNNSKDILEQLQHDLLRLADAGGTYGAEEVSFLARKLDLELKLLIRKNDPAPFIDEINEKLNEWLNQLSTASKEWVSSEIPVIKITKSREKIKSNLVYTLLGDEVFATELITNLEKYSCNVKCFYEINVIEAVCEIENPAVIIVDENFVENDVAGINVVAALKNDIKSCAPIIYISNSNGAESRLIAARADADRYFCKPVTMNKIVHTIKGLVSQVNHLPYRVLIIDNDVPLLECYATILTESDLIVESISEPLKAFEIIETFKPDVIVIDMYMPECSGAELVHMIRQDDRWELIPVIFLSAEQDINNQLEAMALGADDFLVKPVNAKKLLATINATAKRARKNVKLNRDLKNSLQENKYQLVTLDKHAIVSSTDVAGRIIHVNDKLCEISGFSREELVGNNHRMLKSNYHDEAFYKDLWSTISSGNIWHGFICNLTKEGSEYWLESTIVPFLDEKGKPYKYVSVRTDMTNLRTSEQRLKRSQDFANIGTWDWNITTGELFWSERIWPLFGYKKEITETSYDNFVEAVHPDDRKMLKEAVSNCVVRGEEYDIEHRVIWADGSVHWLHESGDVVRNNAGEPQHMLGVVQDITVLKEAEIRQRCNNEILEMIVKGKPLKDTLQQIVLHAEMMMAQSICSILLLDDSGKHLTDCIAPGLPDFYNEAIDGIEIGIGNGSCGEAAFTGQWLIANDIMQHPNWETYRELATKANLHACWSQPFSSSKGNVLGTFAIYFNEPKEPNIFELELLVELAQFAAIAVEREQSQQALLGAKEEAENANLAKSQFLSSMSHELRTPMNAIMGFSQLLKMAKKEPLTDTQETNVNEIMVAGKHLMSLINEVLDLAKIESGHIDLSITKVALSKVINESLQLIIPLAQKRGIEILLIKNGSELSIEELVKQDDSAWLDETRLKQTILNLLSNAVKYNKERGKITLTCDNVSNDLFRISVTDTGNGLDQKQQKHLFKAFDRLGLEQTEIEGTGIGLVITKKIVELMGGTIGVESEVGVGSTFWVELPLRQDKQINENDSLDQSSLMENDMSKLEHKKSVLYIEDNPANLRLVEQILQAVPNLHMWSAPEPLLGLELAMEHLPDLILLDINLPGMDGYEVLKHLRSEDASKDIPVIAISANAMPKDLKKGEEAGFDGYITKPVNVKELLEKVESKLSEK